MQITGVSCPDREPLRRRSTTTATSSPRPIRQAGPAPGSRTSFPSTLGTEKEPRRPKRALRGLLRLGLALRPGRRRRPHLHRHRSVRSPGPAGRHRHRQGPAAPAHDHRLRRALLEWQHPPPPPPRPLPLLLADQVTGFECKRDHGRYRPCRSPCATGRGTGDTRCASARSARPGYAAPRHSSAFGSATRGRSPVRARAAPGELGMNHRGQGRRCSDCDRPDTESAPSRSPRSAPWRPTSCACRSAGSPVAGVEAVVVDPVDHVMVAPGELAIAEGVVDGE